MKLRKHLRLVLIGLLCVCLSGCAAAQKADPFASWTEDAPPVAALEAYVQAVTREGSAQFIPVQDRVAVFDLDGTLYCETFPIYGEWLLFADYVLNTPGYTPDAHVLAVAQELSALQSAADIPPHMEQTHILAHAQAFAGMTVEEYTEIVQSFKETQAAGFSGMTRGEAFFQPMLEVVDYLIAHDFTVYICSGTGRFTVRALIDGVIDIPARQVIGSDFTLVASGQGTTTDMHYNFSAEDELLLGDVLITKNVRMSKVAQLEQEVGQKPVLVFGNSSGDVPMAIYADTDNPYPTEVFFILCDDTQREHGNPEKAQAIAALCEQMGWHTISMARDFASIYPQGVTAVGNA